MHATHGLGLLQHTPCVFFLHLTRFVLAAGMRSCTLLTQMQLALLMQNTQLRADSEIAVKHLVKWTLGQSMGALHYI